MIRLVGKLPSPFVRKVCIVLAEKEIAYEMVVTAPWFTATEPNPEVSRLNPLQKVPILVCEDGEVLFDSSVIVEYLDGLDTSSPLLIEGPGGRLRIKLIESLADGICDAGVAVVSENNRQVAHERSATWIARQLDKARQGIGWLADALDDRTWLCGERMTLADIAAGTALAYADFRLPAIDWRPHYPRLARYEAMLAERPSFYKTRNAADRVEPDS